MIELLKKVGVDYVIFIGVEFNLKICNIKVGKKMYEEEKCDFIIIVGGGFVYDCGKGIGIILINGDDIIKLVGIEMLDNLLLFLMVVNIIVGIGLELIWYVVIMNEEDYLKFVVVFWCNILLVFFNDLMLMFGVLKLVIVVIGCDVFV